VRSGRSRQLSSDAGLYGLTANTQFGVCCPSCVGGAAKRACFEAGEYSPDNLPHNCPGPAGPPA
jgi:hypothetical protein